MDILLYIFLPLLFLLLHTSSQHILHKLQNHPPTPFPSLPLIGHLYLLRKPFHRALSDISNRYGPLIFLRFGSRPVLLISSPSLAEECFTKNDIIFANRPSLLNGKHFGYNYTSIPWSPRRDHWRNLRRIASLDLLSSHRIHTLSRIRADEIRVLIRKLFRLGEENPGKVVHVKEALFEFTFNVLTGMICGKRYFGENVENLKESEVFRDIINETVRVVPDAQVVDFLPLMRWFGFGEVEKKMMLIQEKRDRFMQNVLQELRRLENGDSSVPKSDNAGVKKIIAEVLLDMQKSEPAYYTDEMIRNLLLVLLQAGSDTTANTLEWAFSLLLDNPRAFKTLRLHPPGPLLLPHESSADCTVGGFRVPRGTILLVNVWHIQNSPEVWEDPRQFKPERFRDFEGGGKNWCEFLPFGSGRRACPGENLAMRVVALALGTLIQCFEWEKVCEIDMNEGTGFTAPKIQPLTARCCPRPDIVNLLD
ncbi:hypothetical protein DH2020_008234 [Rehmannia glutinosa]|uniref:Cytochrome P450 protein n=1 Tax=Rehmannia glutinosa TaxID=99300 RepID=A0ABR0U188_REHGL